MDDAFAGKEMALFGMGCFWGAEKGFWLLPGVHSTSVGYAGGYTPNASYEEVCSGQTGHTEVVRVVFDPAVTSYDAMLKQFWEGHDATQGMRQGADIGTHIVRRFTTTPTSNAARPSSRAMYQKRLTAAGFGRSPRRSRRRLSTTSPRTTTSSTSQKSTGYCGHGGTGVAARSGSRASSASMIGRGAKTRRVSGIVTRIRVAASASRIHPLEAARRHRATSEQVSTMLTSTRAPAHA